MKIMVGIDLHSNNALCGLLDESGGRLVHKKLPCDLPAILQLLDPYKDPQTALDTVTRRFPPRFPPIGLAAVGAPSGFSANTHFGDGTWITTSASAP